MPIKQGRNGQGLGDPRIQKRRGEPVVQEAVERFRRRNQLNADVVEWRLPEPPEKSLREIVSLKGYKMDKIRKAEADLWEKLRELLVSRGEWGL
jgi:hypothetical protein